MVTRKCRQSFLIDFGNLERACIIHGERTFKKNEVVVFCNDISTIISSYVFTHKVIFFSIVWFYLVIITIFNNNSTS